MRFILVHGFRGDPSIPPWFVWMKELLITAGQTVHVPAMPNPQNPDPEKWEDAIIQELDNNFEELVAIGHSLGGLALLRALQRSKDKALMVALVATPYSDVGKPQIAEFLPPLNWKKIKSATEQRVFFYSADDPYVPLQHGQSFQKKLGGDLITFSDRGHFEGEKFIELPQYIERQLETHADFFSTNLD